MAGKKQAQRADAGNPESLRRSVLRQCRLELRRDLYQRQLERGRPAGLRTAKSVVYLLRSWVELVRGVLASDYVKTGTLTPFAFAARELDRHTLGEHWQTTGKWKTHWSNRQIAMLLLLGGAPLTPKSNRKLRDAKPSALINASAEAVRSTLKRHPAKPRAHVG